MTNAEWIKQYPEDWYEASEVENFNPDRYEIIWNEEYTHFRAKRLQHWDQASYICYQSGE